MYSVCISALLEQHWAPASDSLKIYPYTACGLHTWAPACAVTMCCLLSFLWLPWPSAPTTHFQSNAPLRPFFNLAGRTSPPIASCYCTKHSLISLYFPQSLSLLATRGNDSITYDPIHLLMMFGHSKAHLRLPQSSSHSLCSSLSVSVL